MHDWTDNFLSHSTFEQERTQLVDDSSASGDQTIADSMNGLQI
jgi:hypothetical protein